MPFELPPLIPQNGVADDAYLDMLFNVFCEDYVSNPIMIGGKRIGIESTPWVNGKHRTFWHLISKGPVEPDRNVVAARCERIRWPRQMILNATQFKTWRNVRGGEHSLLIATDDFGYLVVLRQRKGYYYLWSAYEVEFSSQRRKLCEEWEAYQKSRPGP